MINHHNAPEYRYNGYSYVPYIAHEDEEGIRKASHRVVNMVTGAEFKVDHSPYRWMEREEFEYHIDMMFGEVDRGPLRVDVDYVISRLHHAMRENGWDEAELTDFYEEMIGNLRRHNAGMGA